MTRYTIMEQYYQKLADKADDLYLESTLIPSSLKIRLQDLAFLTALSKHVHESRNSIVSSMISSSIQEEIPNMTDADLMCIGDLANEETKALYEKHFKGHVVPKHYLLKLAEKVARKENEISE